MAGDPMNGNGLTSDTETIDRATDEVFYAIRLGCLLDISVDAWASPPSTTRSSPLPSATGRHQAQCPALT